MPHTSVRDGTPELRARRAIDAQLADAGWLVQYRAELNLTAGSGVAVREFALAGAHGFADYVLFVDGQAVGALEAKPEGHTLRGVEPQADKYARGLPATLEEPIRPLPFLCSSTGVETPLTNLLDPDPRSRRDFQIHRPETPAEWLTADTLEAWVRGNGACTAADDTRPSTLRARLRAILPPVGRGDLYANQLEAVQNLESSLFQNRPRALIQMAIGSGKMTPRTGET